MNEVQRIRATYNFEPVDRLCRREFGIWETAIERWISEGMDPDAKRRELFGYDPDPRTRIWQLGWTEPELCPAIKPKVLEARDDYEVVLDAAGRQVKYFKGKRHGFMPTYLKHAVTGDEDWNRDVLPLLQVDTPQRWKGFDANIAKIKAAAEQGKFVEQMVIGGYMFLRSLIGPEEVCYMFVDNPKLVHEMMANWLELADTVTSRVQQHVQLDGLFLAEDVAYNHGLLVSPDMVKEFLFPYYQQLIANIRSRQEGKRLFIEVDTDGNLDEALDLYIEGIGLDYCIPFESQPVTT